MIPQSEVALTVEHESAHLAVAKMLGLEVSSIRFPFMDDDMGTTVCLVSSNGSDDWADACVSAAPLAVKQLMSATDMADIAESLLESAQEWVIANAERIRAVASDLINDRLFLFTEGWRGVLHDPLGNNPRLEAL